MNVTTDADAYSSPFAWHERIDRSSVIEQLNIQRIRHVLVRRVFLLAWKETKALSCEPIATYPFSLFAGLSDVSFSLCLPVVLAALVIIIFIIYINNRDVLTFHLRYTFVMKFQSVGKRNPSSLSLSLSL